MLGMGRMGVALALKLIDGGHSVTVWNRSPGKAAEVVKAGATEGSSIAEAVSRAELVFAVLTDDAAVRAVALGRGGLRESLKDGSTYVECSTVSPQLTEELSGIFSSFVAMPVIGGPAAVSKGQATYLAGGSEAAVAHLAPVLRVLEGPVRRYEAPGLANTAKLATNLLLLSGLVALAESCAVGRSGGLNDSQITELLEGTVAPGLKSRFAAVLGGPWDGWWTTSLGAKDAWLAIDVARGGGYDLPLATVTRETYLRAALEGFADEDIAAVRHMYSH